MVAAAGGAGAGKAEVEVVAAGLESAAPLEAMLTGHRRGGGRRLTATGKAGAGEALNMRSLLARGDHDEVAD